MDGSLDFRKAQAAEGIVSQFAQYAGSGMNPGGDFMGRLLYGRTEETARQEAAALDRMMAPANAISKAFREHTRAKRFATQRELVAKGYLSGDMLAKANLDVGTQTNFTQITGGQTLGYTSLDTQIARGTVRPKSFTMYQALNKSAAFQIIDYWPSVTDTGGGLPGTAFQGYSSVGTGTLQTSAGVYNMNEVTLKLATNGRAITTALAAQNSFVDIAGQETINASLTILETVNWACYFGTPTLYPNQFNGIINQIVAQNTFDYQTFYNANGVAAGWTAPQALFNLIYEASAQITSYRQYGNITHAFMSPVTAGALQGLVTTILNNIVTGVGGDELGGIVVNGDLQGMKTRFGEIQFPIDLYINAREKPAQAIVYENGTNAATLVNPTRPVSVTAVATTAVAGSAWTAAYAASSGIYTYAVASTDSAMNESLLTYALGTSGIAAGGANTLTITPPADTTAAAFRVYRSGLGYNPASSGVANPGSFRYIGSIAANGSTAVSFVDLNTKIPGSETIFLLDFDEADNAIDFRYLLPLSKIDLFAQNLFMPWAVAMIGSVRLRIPKFHGLIKNFVPDNPQFSPLQPNPAAT